MARAITDAMPWGIWAGALLVGVSALLLARQAMESTTDVDRQARDGAIWLLSGMGLVVATLASSILTFNDFELALGAMPLAAGMLLCGVRRLARRRVTHAIVVVVSVGLVVDAARGYTGLALSRRANDMVVTAEDRGAPLGRSRLRALGFSVWKAPPDYVSAADSFEPLLEWFESRPGNFILIGDESILYGLTGRPSVPPLLWFHPAITFRNDTAGRARVDDWLAASLQRHSVRWVVIPANASWFEWDERTFESVRQRLAGRTCAQVGTYRVCDVGR
jgi:hypothetical protein